MSQDLQLAKRALRKPCRLHPAHKSATCPECYELAAEQQDVQWARERRREHRRYETRIAT